MHRAYPAGPDHIEYLINRRPMRLSQWRALGLCSIVAMLDGFDLQVMSFVAPVISERYGFSSEVMGTLLAAALAGLMIGSLLASPLSDRWGRKPVIIAACVLMGLFSLLTAFAESAVQFLTLRFLTGLGLGAALPNVQTLTAEIVPQNRRALLMTLMFLGFPFGAIVGGIGSAPLISAWGWQAPFVAGGVLPLIVAIFLMFSLNESIRWLARHRPNDPQLADFVGEDTKEPVPAGLEEARPMPGSFNEPITDHPLGCAGRSLTLSLWLLFFANLMLLYTLLTWLPSLVSRLGQSLEASIHAAVAFNIGGAFGGLILAWLMDRIGGVRALTAAYGLALILLPLVAILKLDGPLLLLGILILGIPVAGTPFGVSALAASLYATPVRGRGVGWALAIGRLGAVIGPMLAGYVLGFLAVWEFVMASTILVVLCLGAIVILKVRADVTLSNGPLRRGLSQT